MAYNIYTPMQGPTIPTSIFSSAMERGARTGKLIDSPETAKLKGQIEGKTKALDMQMKREQIESANINQEAARVGIERQEEALEADKRANKLAPIKEGLGIAGSVIGLVQGVQGIMGNSNKLEQQEQQIELNQIKLDTQSKIAGITALSAENTAKADNAKATREISLMSTQDSVNESIAKKDKELTKRLMGTHQFQTFLQEQPDNAATMVESAFRIGALNKAERDGYTNSIFASKNNALENQIRLAEAKADQKAKEDFNTNFNNLNATMGNALAARNPSGKATAADFLNTEYYAKQSVTITKDGKIDRDNPPKEAYTDIEGEYVAVDTRTDEVITYLRKGYETKQQADAFKRSMLSIKNTQKDNASKSNIHQDNKGIWQLGPAPTSPQGPQQSRQRPLNGVEDAGLAAHRKRLGSYGLAPRENVGQQGTGIGSWYDRLKTAVNRIAPWAVDAVSEGDMQSADKAAEAMAKETIKQYKSASPAERKSMMENLKTKIPMTARKIAEIGEADRARRGDRPRPKSFQKGPESVEDHYFGYYGHGPLKKIFKDEIVESMEAVREGAIDQRAAEPKKLSNEERKQQHQRDAVQSAPNPLAALEASRTYDKLKGQPTRDLTVKDPRVTAAKVSNAAGALQVRNGWSDAKKVSVEQVANTIEVSPYLRNEPPEIKAIAAVESKGDPNAVSPTNVPGLMQISSVAAADVNRSRNVKLDRNVPEDNVEIGKAYLTGLFTRYNDNKALAYAAYNVGMGNIDDAIHLAGGKTTWEAVRGSLLEALKANYVAGKTVKTPWDAFMEVYNYPERVFEYEQLFNQLR